MNRELTADEVRDLVLGNMTGDDVLDSWEEVEEVDGGRRRWSTTIASIFKTPSGDFFAVEWERGNTECQEHEFHEQVPQKVERVPVTTYQWRPAQ